MKKYPVAARAWIVTINNPENYGYSDCPCVLCEQLRAQWLSERPSRSGVWMFCVSDDGVPHVHMVLIDTVPFRDRHIYDYVPADSAVPLATSHDIVSDVEHFVRHILDKGNRFGDCSLNPIASGLRPSRDAALIFNKRRGYMGNSVTKSWFAVLNNPQEHGYFGTPQEICEQLRDEWVGTSTTRTGAWAYCISALGLHHIHMVLEDAVAMRFSVIKKTYACGMHFEATKGTKKQAEDYIHKRSPFDEKGEQVLCIVKAGEIKGRSANRSDLAEIEALLKEGYTPSDIMASNLNFRRYDRMIRDAFFDQRFKSTPPIRPVTVHWICGESGAGKTYHYVTLCNDKGEDNIYLVSDLKHGAFDKYCAEEILFLDELKPDSISYSELLSLLDGYKKQISARYTNSFALWSDVYITSVYSPEQLYAELVPYHKRGTDTYEQLRRRISEIVYCYFDADHKRKFVCVSSDFYNDISSLRASLEDNTHHSF